METRTQPVPLNQKSKIENRKSITLLRLLLVLMAAVVVFRIAAVLLANYPSLRDDAYMFVRYADNLIQEGVLAWNPGGDATYGLTSPLYLLLVVPIRLLLPDNAALAILLSSLLSGFLFIALLIILLLRYVDAGKKTRQLLILAVLWALAITLDHQADRFYDDAFTYFPLVNHLANHFISGMDTMFVLSYLTLYIIAAKHHERAPTVASALLLGGLGGLALFARPDLLLYTVTIPLFLLLFAPDRLIRRRAFLVFVITVILVGLGLVLANLYFGSPLPLPFYAKGLMGYGDAFIQVYSQTAFIQFAGFVTSYWYLFLSIGAALVWLIIHRQKPRRAVEAGLLLATTVFLLYYLFFVLQIIGFSHRFYYPTLPALIFLAAQSAAFLQRQLPQAARTSFRAFTQALPGFYVILALLFLIGTLVPLAPTARDFGLRLSRKDDRFLTMTVTDNYQTFFQEKWLALDSFSALPDDLVIATTEVGHPAAMNPGKQIIDLAGLNNTEFAHSGFSAETLTEDFAPDLIYMPHPDYQSMIRQIEDDPSFQEQYDYFPPALLGRDVQMGLALRLDSPYYPSLRDIVDRNIEGQTAIP